MAVAVSSASGLLSLLEEDDVALNLHALQALNRVVHDFWFQIAGSISAIESFAEDEGFSHRELSSAGGVKGARACTQAGPAGALPTP